MKRDGNFYADAIGYGLLTLGAIGTIKLMFEMHQLGLYPWQRTATIQAPMNCEPIAYKSPPGPKAPTCKPTDKNNQP